MFRRGVILVNENFMVFFFLMTFLIGSLIEKYFVKNIKRDLFVHLHIIHIFFMVLKTVIMTNERSFISTTTVK